MSNLLRRQLMLALQKIKIGARASNLSKAQVKEVIELIAPFNRQYTFEPEWMETVGDKDKSSSLKEMDNSDFFTKELDEALLNGRCRLAVHSAKDLPFPLASGVKLACLTTGLTSQDSLVYRSLKEGAIIGSSSKRRDEVLKLMREDFCIKDIRGTIEERLEKMYRGEYDAVVIAECALIRLGLIDLDRIPLKGVHNTMQGRLAIVAREDDCEMLSFFDSIHI